MKWTPDDYLLFRPPPGSRDVRGPQELDSYATILASLALSQRPLAPSTRFTPYGLFSKDPVLVKSAKFRIAFKQLWNSNNVDRNIRQA